MTKSAASLYAEGMPIKLIARELGVSSTTVSRNLLDDPNYSPCRLGGTRVSRQNSDAAIELENAGKSWRSISLELGISANALKRAIKYYAAQDSI